MEVEIYQEKQQLQASISKQAIKQSMLEYINYKQESRSSSPVDWYTRTEIL
jgi:hypothetical protein